MLFPAATIGDLQLRLLLIRPDFNPEAGRPVEVAHRFDTLLGEGQTSIEERRPARRALLHTQSCTLFLRDATTADDWRKGLAALGPRPVGVPLWVDAMPPLQWKAQRIYDAQKVVNFDPETGDFAILDGPAILALSDLTFSTIVTLPLLAPLLVGRWSERPGAEVLNDRHAFVRVSVAEASPWSCRIAPRAHGSGWATLPDGGMRDVSDYGLEAATLAAAREPVLNRTNAAARWRQEGDFKFADRLAIRAALTHFAAMQGATTAWDNLPAWFQPGADTDATPDSYTARFASDTLALTYLAGHVARATVGFIQEIATPGRDQAHPGEFHLYRLTYQHDADNPELFTDCDEPLVGPEGTYQPRQIAHQEIRRSLRPQDDKATLRLEYRAGSLADAWLGGRLFGWVLLTVWKCDPSDPAGTRGAPLYSGFVSTVAPAGNVLSLEATLFGRLLKERAPGDVYGRQCNTFVFSPRCGLAEGEHDSAGTAASADLSSDGRTLTVHGVTGWGGTAYADNWFAQGVLRTGTGRSRVVVTVLASAMNTGNVVVKLARPIPAGLLAVGGQAVQLVPGCGRQYVADCGEKFDNQENFQGFEFVPDYIEQAAPSAPKTPKK